MKKINSNELLIDIRERIVAIETHLKDMNGRIIKHDIFLSDVCPAKHIDVERKITKVMTTVTIIMVIAFTIIEIIIRKSFGG